MKINIVFDSFKVYPNPYVVYSSDGMLTKHYFAGDQRIASKIGDSGGIFTNRQATPANKREGNDPESNAENDFKKYLSKAGFEKTEIEKEFARGPYTLGGVYYLHGDHLGTATYVTNEIAEPTQFFLNLPFGETMAEQMTGVHYNPYKFNAKELDAETGLYYYGARYYNPRLSVWYGVDPLAVYNPVTETQFYGDGQHNGGVYFWGNLNPYIYTYQNPIYYIDPNGKQAGNSVLLTAQYTSIYDFFGRSTIYGYKFTPAAAHLISLASGVNEQHVSNALITFSRVPIGGGALTGGQSSSKGKIHVYHGGEEKGLIYNTNAEWISGFLGLMTHEAGHLPQIDRAGSEAAHFGGSLVEYIKNWSHLKDSHDPTYAKKENEAEAGYTNFRNFSDFVDMKFGGGKDSNMIDKLFKNKNNSQEKIIKTIDKWWDSFKKNK